MNPLQAGSQGGGFSIENITAPISQVATLTKIIGVTYTGGGGVSYSGFTTSLAPNTPFQIPAGYIFAVQGHRIIPITPGVSDVKYRIGDSDIGIDWNETTVPTDQKFYGGVSAIDSRLFADCSFKGGASILQTIGSNGGPGFWSTEFFGWLILPERYPFYRIETSPDTYVKMELYGNLIKL